MQTKRIITATIVGVLATIAAKPASAELKIGTVDVQRVRKESPAFKAALTKIDEMVADFEKRRDDKQAELESLSQELQQASDRNLPASVDRLRRDLADKSQAFQKFMEETFGTEGLIETSSQEKLAPLYENLATAAEKVAKTQLLDLILDLEQINPLFVSKSLDVTDAVLAELAKLEVR